MTARSTFNHNWVTSPISNKAIIFKGEKFYYGIALVELFLDLLSSKTIDTVLEIYSEVEGVKASVAKHPKTGVTGLLVETEMEKFKCVQCGHCCLDLSDAYQTSVPESDVKRWKREQRFDIL